MKDYTITLSLTSEHTLQKVVGLASDLVLELERDEVDVRSCDVSQYDVDDILPLDSAEVDVE